jgi:hypothetical protein
MRKVKATDSEKFCGNCTSHNAYEYPGRVFCTRRFLRNKDAVVQTLWHCEDWIQNAQECHCVKDAKEEQK